MTAAANIVLADALGTPVDHTFIPIGPDANGVWWYEDQSAASSIGNGRISVELKRPPTAKAKENSSERVFRVKVGLHRPITETLSNSTISGIPASPTVAYVPRVVCEFMMSERSILQDRKDLRKMVALLLADAQVVAAVESLQGVW